MNAEFDTSMRYFKSDDTIKNGYSTKNIEKKWTTRCTNWDMIYNELNILYPYGLN